MTTMTTMTTTLWTTKSTAEAAAQRVGGTAHDLGDGESWYVPGERSAVTGTCSRWERSEDGRAVIAGEGAPEL